MPLVDVRGFNLDPRIGQGLSGGLQTLQRFQQFGQQNLALQREADVRSALSGVQQPEFAPQTQQQQMLAEQTAGLGGALAQEEQPQPIKTQEEKIRIAQDIDPAIANKQLKAMGLDDASKRAEMSRFAAELEATPFEMRSEKINARAEKLRSEGRDPFNTLKLLDLDEQDQNQGLLGIQLLDLTTKERLGIKAAAAKAGVLGGPQVKSSKILDDGTTIQSMKDGTTQVISSTGEVLTGDARSVAIKEAQKFAVELQGQRAQEREGGKGAAKIALNAFERVGKIRENIADLQKGVDLIEKEGATTGFIQDFLPNMKASTRKLANLRRRLGLNVVGAVTFGALSKGELDLAMDVALPKGISPEETVKWIKERQAAQEKLAENLEQAALFLSEPGNSVADFIRFTKKRDSDAKKTGGAPTAAVTQQRTQQAQPTGKTATNPTTGEKLQEMSDGTWRAI